MNPDPQKIADVLEKYTTFVVLSDKIKETQGDAKKTAKTERAKSLGDLLASVKSLMNEAFSDVERLKLGVTEFFRDKNVIRCKLSIPEINSSLESYERDGIPIAPFQTLADYFAKHGLLLTFQGQFNVLFLPDGMRSEERRVGKEC